MLTLEQIKELAEMVSRLELGGVEVERSGFRVKIKGKPPAKVSAVAAQAAPHPVAGPSSPQAGPGNTAGAAVPDEDDLSEGTETVHSPFVGTFYRSPSPDADPFVEPGTRVEPGQVLCIIEAMKLMNELEADQAGVIADVLVENGQPVEYGQALFTIRTA